MSRFNTCPKCGSNLDCGEKCDCVECNHPEIVGCEHRRGSVCLIQTQDHSRGCYYRKDYKNV